MDGNGGESEANIIKVVRQAASSLPYIFNMFVEKSVPIIKRKIKGTKVSRTRI